MWNTSDQAARAVRMTMNLQRFAEDGSQAGQSDPPAGSQNVTIDGVEYTPEQLKELISKGSDYTKKTQQLAAQRKEFEAKQAELEKLAPYADFINNIEGNPQFQQHVINAVQAFVQGQQTGQVATQSDINAIKKAAETTGDDDTRAMLEDMRLDMELNKLKSKYEDLDEDELLAFAMENEIDNLDHAYKLMNFDKAQEKAAKNALEKAKKGAQVPRSQTGNTGSSPGSNPSPPKTFGEARNAVAEYLRSMRADV